MQATVTAHRPASVRHPLRLLAAGLAAVALAGGVVALQDDGSSSGGRTDRAAAHVPYDTGSCRVLRGPC